jgi:2-haloacid dehalogenase/putative hydrolase of the HAD superfamily
MTAGPSAVLFDVGNVIVRWDPRTLYSKIFPDPDERDRFLSDVCSMAWHLQHDRGADMADTIPVLAAAHPRYAEAIAAWLDRHPEMFSGAIPETEAVIEALHAAGVPLYALTNMPADYWAHTQSLSPVFGRFRDIVVSSDEGLIKPDPRIFEIACARSGFAPEELLFIDDSVANVEAARALGFAVHRFDDPAALRPAIEAHGLL